MRTALLRDYVVLVNEVKAPNSWTLFCTKFTLHMMFKLGQCAEKKWR